MNSIGKKLGVFALAAVLSSCKEQAQTRDANPADTARHIPVAAIAMTDSAVKIAVIKDSRLQALFQQYSLLSEALVNGKDRDAILAANALEAGARDMNEGVIAAAAGSIVHARALVERRTLFAAVSREMIARVKKAGLHSGTLYVDFCPMALDDKGGYWLSATKDIRNPYFGDEMLTCGTVEDSIR